MYYIGVCRRDSLGVAGEGEVFDALTQWAESEVKAGRGSNVKDVLTSGEAPLINLVRFPLMSASELASKAAGAGLLDHTLIVELFTCNFPS
jgi:hypothetical protein